MKELINNINRWFKDRGLDRLNGQGQLTKLKEEVQELEDAYHEYDYAEMIDAVGDITVVLIGFCLQLGLDYEECVKSAYEEIKDRKGQVIDGVFVKEEK